MKSMTKLIVVAMILAAALVVTPVVAAPRASPVGDGGSIYVGEENLNLTDVFIAPFGGAGTLVFAPGESNQKTIPVYNVSEFTVLPADIGSATGVWYAYNNTAHIQKNGAGSAGSVQIQTPSANLEVLLAGTTTSMDKKPVTRGQSIDFRISHNLGGLPSAQMNIEVTTPDGGKVTMIDGKSLAGVFLTGQRNTVSGIPMKNLTVGTYTAKGVWKGPDTTGTGFDTNTVTFEVTTGALSITANKDSVVRGNGFTVTITGESKTDYLLSVKGADAKSPMIAPGQTEIPSYIVPGEDDWNRTIKTTGGGTATILSTPPRTPMTGHTLSV